MYTGTYIPHLETQQLLQSNNDIGKESSQLIL